ncbi:MAG: hypothetical protein MUF24_00360 [Chitinophagaceae bacterium]|nr:hypothetical protein [Chitinophagaceae bacterium]
MKTKITGLVCAALLTAFTALAQVEVTEGTWVIKPYADGIVKLSWSHDKIKKNEAFTEVVLPGPLDLLPFQEKGKTVWPGQPYVTQAKKNGMVVAFPDVAIEFYHAFDSGHVRGFRLYMEEKGLWYGGGERALPLIRNGQIIPLNNAPAYGYGEGQAQLNYSVPFVFSTLGFGLFFDNPSQGYIDFGKERPQVLEAGFSSGALDVYVIPGKTPAEIMQRFSGLTGRQPLPPRWALGNFISRFGYRSQQQALEVATAMKKAGYPADAVIIDLFWFGKTIQHTLGNLDWDKDQFPEPDKMINTFKQDSLQTILITEPFFIEKTLQYANSVPYLATNRAGQPFTLQAFYFGKGGLIDIFRQDARTWFWQFYKKQTDRGVTGWWGDLGEPEQHPDGIYHNLKDFGITRPVAGHEVHNLYGHLWSKMVYDNWTKDYPGKRLFFLNRAGYAGSSRFSTFPWTGDVGRNWSGFRAQLPNLQSSSLSGIPYIHSDAGGFAMTDTADAELYIRWMQMAAFTPVFRPHGTALGEDMQPKGTISLPGEAVFWDEKTQEIIKPLIMQRYRLLPYNYTLAWEQTTQGHPLIRPMNYYDARDANLAEATNQYFWGASLLVAPVTERGATTKNVYLPPGEWYRLKNGTLLTGGKWYNEEVTQDYMPVFVKGGAVLPIWNKQLFTNTQAYNWKDTLTLCYFPAAGGHNNSVYDDNGEHPDAYKQADSHLLLSLETTLKKDEMVVTGILKNDGSGHKRIAKIQLPVAALNQLKLTKDWQKWVVRLNGLPVTPTKVSNSLIPGEWIEIIADLSAKKFELTWTKK